MLFQIPLLLTSQMPILILLPQIFLRQSSGVMAQVQQEPYPQVLAEVLTSRGPIHILTKARSTLYMSPSMMSAEQHLQQAMQLLQLRMQLYQELELQYLQLKDCH